MNAESWRESSLNQLGYRLGSGPSDLADETEFLKNTLAIEFGADKE